MSIKIGLGATASNDEKFLWTMPSNTTITAKILVDSDHIITGDFCQLKHNGTVITWAFSGNTDPGVELDINPRFCVVVPMLVKIGSEQKVLRNFRGPKQIQRQIEAISYGIDTLRGAIVDITRKDGEFASYTLRYTGKHAKTSEDQDQIVAQIVDQIIQGTPDEVRNKLIEIVGATGYKQLIKKKVSQTANKLIVEEDF
jgi:hypothetical protein